MAEIRRARVEEYQHQYRHHSERHYVKPASEGGVHRERKQREQPYEGHQEEHRAVVVEIVTAKYVEIAIKRREEYDHVEYLPCHGIIMLAYGTVATLIRKLLVGLKHGGKTCGHNVPLVYYSLTLLYHTDRRHSLLIGLFQHTPCGDGIKEDIRLQHFRKLCL